LKSRLKGKINLENYGFVQIINWIRIGPCEPNLYCLMKLILKMTYSNQKISSLIVLLLLAFFANAQTKISGKVTSDGEALIGANVLVITTSQGASTDVNGNFELETDGNLPFEIEVSYTGYDTKTITVTSDNKNDLMIELTTGGISLDQVVVGASRHSERFVEAPVTIEKIDGAAPFQGLLLLFMGPMLLMGLC